jgi:hypothetical protein
VFSYLKLKGLRGNRLTTGIGLKEAGYRVHLMNTAAVKQYEELKYTDDDSDAFWLAHLLRLGILPTWCISIPNKTGRSGIYLASPPSVAKKF